MPKYKSKIEHWVKTLIRVVRRYNADDGLTMSGALSFYFLMSILPLSLLGLSFLGFILGNKRDAVGFITTLGRLEQIMPQGSIEIKRILGELVSGKGVIGVIGIALLFWFAGGVFYTVEVAINKIFRTGVRRGFFKRTLVVYFLMLVAGGLLISSISLTVIQSMIADLSVGVFGIDPAKIPLLWNLFISLAIPAEMMLMFTIIYKVGPTSVVRWNSAFKGGFFAAILWEISRRLFGWYLSNMSVYNKLYGALGAIVALLIWLFYSSNIFIIGAEFAAISKERLEKKISEIKKARKEIGESRNAYL